MAPLPRLDGSRHWVSLAEHGNGPMVAVWPGSSVYRIAHLATAVRTYHQLGTRAEPAPLPGDVRRFQRLNAVAGAVAHFQRAMMMDIDQAAKAMDEEVLAEIEDFIEGFNQPTFRGMRINGQRVATWSSRDGWSGDGRPEVEWLR
jgi:hypothetical protein